MQSASSFFKGRVSFQADFSEVEFEPIEVSPPFDGVARATIRSSSSEGIFLEVEISRADTFDSAIAKAQEVAKYLAKVVTFKFGVFQKEFRYVSSSLSEEETLPDGNTRSIAWCVSRDSSYASLESWKILGEEQIKDLKGFLEKNNHNSFPYYDLFYSALGLTDPIAKFMVLYLVVLNLCKTGNRERQEDVDKFVLSIEPQVLTFNPFCPRKSGIPETIYTNLRNQVGHAPPNTMIQSTRIQSTREEMEKNLGGLIKITREIISRQP